MQAEKRARFKSPHGLSGSSPSEHLPHLGSVQVKRAVVQVISAMAHHGYLEQPGGEAMIQYLVQQCALPPETEVRGRLTHLPCPEPVCSVGESGHQKQPGPMELRWVGTRVTSGCVPSSFLQCLARARPLGGSGPQSPQLRKEMQTGIWL